MPFVIGKSDSEIDVDSLTTFLLRTFPESSMISDDYYMDRLQRQKEIAREKGMDDNCAPIRCTERVAAERGIQRHLAIRVSPVTTLDTRIDKSGVLAVGGNDTIDCPPNVQKLIDILHSYRLKIETSWDDVK
jgi:hypothetical protein